jgi:hypothetical protein
MPRSVTDSAESTAKKRGRKLKAVAIGYKTSKGVMYRAKVEDFLKSPRAEEYVGKVQLIFTSPPDTAE